MRRGRFVFVALFVLVSALVSAVPSSASGFVDAVFAGWEARNRICVNDGAGGFACSDVSSDDYPTAEVAIGLVNGDRYPDAVFANSVSQRDRVCFGDGLGGFSSCSHVDTVEQGSQGVALGFVDDDEHLDAVFSGHNTNSPHRVCLGDGTGSFDCSNVGTDIVGGTGVALGLVDNDQHLDAVFAVWATNLPNRPRNRLCLGDGTGGFACSDVSTDEFNSNAVALGYIDNDQNLDAVFANEEERNRVCLGDGLGGFSCSDVSTAEDFSIRVALGFINDDQFLDAVFASADLACLTGGDGQRNRVCLGDGSGGFTCSDVSTDPNCTTGVGLGHIDDDQYLDAVFANYLGRDRLCLGDGLGGFSCSDLNADEHESYDVALGDMTPLVLPFADGFESGDTSAWSRTVP